MDVAGSRYRSFRFFTLNGTSSLKHHLKSEVNHNALMPQILRLARSYLYRVSAALHNPIHNTDGIALTGTCPAETADVSDTRCAKSNGILQSTYGARSMEYKIVPWVGGSPGGACLGI